MYAAKYRRKQLRNNASINATRGCESVTFISVVACDDLCVFPAHLSYGAAVGMNTHRMIGKSSAGLDRYLIVMLGMVAIVESKCLH